MGQFVIGRSSECQLSLDDPLVSRRHGLLTVREDGTVLVEDLGSRNGVLVNGNKIEGQQTLGDGDRITIGGQTMTLYTTAPAPAPKQPVRHDTASYRKQTETLVMSSAELRDDESEGPTFIGPSPFVGAEPRQPDKRVHGLSLIGGVADKALAMGRNEEAERILKRALADVLQKAKAGEELRAELVEQAAGYAARLAGSTGKGNWFDYIFELYRAVGQILPQPIIDELYSVVRKVKAIDRNTMQTYIEQLRQKSGTFGPNERFLLQRVEGLERLGALK